MLNREIYSLEDIDDILENAICEDNVSFSICCDGKLAEFIKAVLELDYDLVDKYSDDFILDDEIYMISGLSSSDGYQVFIEKVFNEKGVMRLHEIEGVCYVFTEKLTIEQINSNICVDEIILCQLVNDEGDEFKDYEKIDCDCPICQFENDLAEALETALEITTDPDSCIDCKIASILEVTQVFIDAIKDDVLELKD